MDKQPSIIFDCEMPNRETIYDLQDIQSLASLDSPDDL